MWSPSDEALLAGLASGDERAAATLVRRYQARVFGLARTMLGDPTAAEEVAQEAFLRAWRHAGAYDHRRGRVDTWLLEGMELLLMRRNRSEAVSDEVGALTEALAELPPEQRRALILATLYGYTAAEIGEIEGAPLGTTKSRIRSAMLKLRGSERELSDDS